MDAFINNIHTLHTYQRIIVHGVKYDKNELTANSYRKHAFVTGMKTG